MPEEEIIKGQLEKAVSLIKVFSHYQLQIFIIDGVEYVELKGVEALRDSIRIEATEGGLFTETEFLKSKEMIDALTPLLGEQDSPKQLQGEEESKKAAEQKAAGKVNVRLDVEKNKKKK